jgi:hypothetical protein
MLRRYARKRLTICRSQDPLDVTRGSYLASAIALSLAIRRPISSLSFCIILSYMRLGSIDVGLDNKMKLKSKGWRVGERGRGIHQNSPKFLLRPCLV